MHSLPGQVNVENHLEDHSLFLAPDLEFVGSLCSCNAGDCRGASCKVRVPPSAVCRVFWGTAVCHKCLMFVRSQAKESTKVPANCSGHQSVRLLVCLLLQLKPLRAGCPGACLPIPSGLVVVLGRRGEWAYFVSTSNLDIACVIFHDVLKHFAGLLVHSVCYYLSVRLQH